MKTIAVCTHKGGAGKTTTTHWIGHHLSRSHRKHVLLIDLDPQGNLSKLSGYAPPISGYTVADVLRNREKICKVARPGATNIQIAPADIRLEDARAALTGEALGFNALSKAISIIAPGMYDYILIDTPPAADILVVNALVAADWVVTPASPEEHDIDGANRIGEMILWLGSELGKAPRMAGTVATKVNGQTTKHRQNLERLPGPRLGEIPLRQGLQADIDIGEAYRLVVDALLATIEGGDHA
jgi:chromosome partitioning protein